MEKSIELVLILLMFISVGHCIQTLVDVSTEAHCTQTPILNPSGDNTWANAGLDVYVDTFIECGDIIAFKLEWFPVGSGQWSDWFVVGVNDVDTKSDGPALTLKRYWSYFADHRHTFIICYQNKYQGCKCNSATGTQTNVAKVNLAQSVVAFPQPLKTNFDYVQPNDTYDDYPQN